MITVNDISKEISTVVSNFDFKDSVLKVGVFGSISRNEQLKNSDLDLVIDYIYSENIDLLEKCAINYLELCGSIRNTFKKNYKKKVDIVEYKALEYPENKNFKDEIERDVIWIYGEHK